MRHKLIADDGLSVVSAEISIAKLAQPWNNSKILVQCHIDLRGDYLHWREPFTNTMNPLRCLHPKEQTEFDQNNCNPFNDYEKHNRKLTEIRLRKIIQLSGTPFCMRSSIAWLAELPKQIKGMAHQCACWQKGAVWTKDETVHIIERTVRHNLNLHIFLTKEKP